MASFANPHATNGQPRRRRLGRPPSKILKVTISVRIPADLDAFLNNYSEEHDLLKGEVITEALTLFAISKAPATAANVAEEASPNTQCPRPNGEHTPRVQWT